MPGSTTIRARGIPAALSAATLSAIESRYGVDPDIEVIDDPSQLAKGKDPQLDAAIAEMLSEIEKNPYTPAVRPNDPDRSGMGVLEQDH